jgi:uncharacterized protein
VRGLLRRTSRIANKRIFFATDLHGSEQCFRKFLNAGALYDAAYLIIGGDILGKRLVPIVEDGAGRYNAQYAEQRYTDLDSDGVATVKAAIRARGDYPIVTSREESPQFDDAEHMDAVFRKVAYDSVADWVTLAEERLRGSGRRCFVAPGNDDFLEIDSALQNSDVLEFAEDRCIQLDEDYEMITTGYSNPTPWDTERELPENELKARITALAAQAGDPDRLIAVLHPPPYDCQLDLAPRLREDYSIVMTGGQAQMMPVGSIAVREFIEDAQPLLGLHGHVHESAGSTHIGRTLCINPGSEYTQGVLDGAIIGLAAGGVRSHQFVSG